MSNWVCGNFPNLLSFCRIIDSSIYDRIVMASSIVRVVRPRREKRGGDFATFTKGVKERVSALINGPQNGPSKKFREYMGKHGNDTIESLQVCRYPISGIIDKALNLLSFGYFQSEKNRLSYDKLFHLFLLIELRAEDGKKYSAILERNEVINLAPSKASDYKPVGGGCLNVPLYTKQGRGITLSELFNNALRHTPNIWLYDAVYANCQAFVLNILKSSKLNNTTLERFVSQKAETLIPKYLQFIGKRVTNLAGISDILINGAGIRKNKKLNKTH